jgi:ribosomal protein S18 acetylase RimI-like enzyme
MVCLKIIRCGSKHITGVADIFSFAFAESIEFFVPKNSLIKEAVTDIFLMLHHAMDDGFLVAVDDNGTVQGYIVVSGSIRRLWKDALLSGYVFRSLYRWLTGSYGMGPAPVLKVVRNKLFYIGFEMGTGSAGQILSIAVHPDCRGKGIGRALVDRGLNLLKSSGVSTVKLEVRPENNAALKIYSECGFVEKGRTRDLQGEWIIMQLDE